MKKMELVVLLLAILSVMVIIRLKRKKTPSHKEKAANKNISLRKRGIIFWIFSLPKIFVVGIFANPIWRKYGLLTFFSQEFSFWERRRINKILEKFGVERRSSGLCLIPNSRMDLLGFIANQLIYTKKPKNCLAAKKFAKRAQEEIMNNQIDSLEKYKSMVAVITAYKKLFETGICEETDFIAACTIQICIGEMPGMRDLIIADAISRGMRYEKPSCFGYDSLIIYYRKKKDAVMVKQLQDEAIANGWAITKYKRGVGAKEI